MVLVTPNVFMSSEVRSGTHGHTGNLHTLSPKGIRGVRVHAATSASIATSYRLLVFPSFLRFLHYVPWLLAN